jgi:hypothetical protein
MIWGSRRRIFFSTISAVSRRGDQAILTFILSFLVFLAAVGGLALGLVLSGRRIEGSCGGLNKIPGAGSDCGGLCRRPCEKRLARLGLSDGAG